MPGYVDRPPRIQPELPRGLVEIPPPPKEEEQSKERLFQTVIPIVTIIGYVIVSTTGQGSNIGFIIPMALTIFLSTGFTLYTTITQAQKSYSKRKAYLRRLVDLRREMVASHNRQRNFYEYNYPAPAVTLDMRGDKADNRGGSRLWERRTSDDDFGTLRLGKGVRPSSVEYKISQASSDENDENPLRGDAERLRFDSQFVSDVPITIGLYQKPEKSKKRHDDDKGDKKKGDDDAPAIQRVQIRPTVGIAGTPKDVYEFIYSLVVHAAAFHSPSDMQIGVLGLNAAAANWSWLYTLPHCQINVAKGQYRLYFEDCERILAPIDGTISEICVKLGQRLEPGEVVARIRRNDGATVEVLSQTAGRVQDFGRAMAAVGENAPLLDAGKPVSAGMILMRLEDFSLSLQQLEEELDPRKYLNSKTNRPYFGKEREREIAGVARYWKEKIWVDLDRRARRLRDKSDEDDSVLNLPFMLNIVDLLAARPGEKPENDPLKGSVLDDLESEAAVSLMMSKGGDLGGAVMFLVPTRSKVPTGCQAVIELQRDADGVLKFLYAETGVNTPRYVGEADTIVSRDNRPNRALSRFAKNIAAWEVRRSYGADIPRAVGLLPLYKVETIHELQIMEKWRESKEPKRADWPKMPLGMLAGREPRYLHFFADADGVHGMIAGSTGSGKSELLMTMILSLAVKYDPMMVNFVLIDFKGGAAFEPFREMPHVVDIVTNLRGNAVARMFAAINAELNRRQWINNNTDMKDIVRYRKNGLHLQRDDNYPHLFIIIDEFAEMIANNPEYKAQLDSITRLGRALGVSLILAAQRPTGVTDQMRANIKFRICLRVETREESSELLRMPDAAYLPSIPGRGYLQVGSESLENIQVAYTGESYLKEDYNPLDRYSVRPVIWEGDLGKEEDEPTYDVLVRDMAKMAKSIYKDAPRWRKPWPNPLPTYISLDQPASIEVEYLGDDDQDYIKAELAPNQDFVLSPAIAGWMNGSLKAWKGMDWGENHIMRAIVGIIDDPSQALLHLLKVDLTTSHYAIFGASGWGKSIFLRSVITSLLASHSPEELNLYILDFGNRALSIFEDAPHTGAYIVTHEKERVERLLRKLDQIVEERKEILSRANTSNLLEYNSQAPRKKLPKLPAILCVVDNFAEFKETYEYQLDVITSLVRDGLSTGVHFILSGEQGNAIGKLQALIAERITLKLSDDGEYANLVGRGARPVEEIAGRGLRRVDKAPLELQVAMPLGFLDDEEAKSESDRLIDFLTILKQAAKDKGYAKPPAIQVLETWSYLPTLLSEHRKVVGSSFPIPAQMVVGRSDYALEPQIISLDAKPHLIITGPPSSGKTTILQTMIMSLAEAYLPSDVAMVFVDYQGGIVDYGGEHRLDELPHALMPVITEAAQMTDMVNKLENEFLHIENRRPRELFVFIDNYDDVEELTPRINGVSARERMGNLARRVGKQGLHFVICGMRTSMASSDELVRPIAANRFGMATDVESAEASPLYGNLPRSYAQMQLPRGRGFLVMPGKVTMLQIAVAYENPNMKLEQLDGWVQRILNRQYAPAVWPEMVNQPDGEGEEEAGSSSARVTLQDSQRDNILKAISDTMQFDLEVIRNMYGAATDSDLIELARSYGVNLEGIV